MSVKSYKFDWMGAVCDDPQFTPGEARILLCLALNYVTNGSDTTYVSQRTIAARLSFSRQTVITAYRKAEAFGYLAFEAAGEGGRGNRNPDIWRLTMPKKGQASFTHLDAEKGQARFTPCREKGSSLLTKGVKLAYEKGKAANVPTSGNADIPVVYPGGTNIPVVDNPPDAPSSHRQPPRVEAAEKRLCRFEHDPPDPIWCQDCDDMFGVAR